MVDTNNLDFGLDYTGGINKPTPDDIGKFARVDSTGTNVEYVAISSDGGGSEDFRVVADHTARDALAPLTAGQWVVTQNDGIVWKCTATTPSVTWAQIVFGVTAHNQLTGLSADDHTEYLKADGTRALTGDQSFGGHKATSLANGAAASDAATVGQLPGAGDGLTKSGTTIAAKAADASIAVSSSGLSLGTAIATVACATTGNITLSGEQTLDGFTTNKSRVLVWQQTIASQNGIYLSDPSGWVRVSDQDGTADFRPGVFFKIANGTKYGGAFGVLLTETTITVGTSTIQYGITFAGPVPGADDGKFCVAAGGVITYVSALLSHTERRTAQTASIAAVTLLTAPPSDLYSVEFYLECTSAGSAGTVLATVSYTDDTGSTTQATTTLSLSAVGHLSVGFPIWVASGNITFTTTVASAAGSPQYAVTARAQRKWSSN